MKEHNQRSTQDTTTETTVMRSDETHKAWMLITQLTLSGFTLQSLKEYATLRDILPNGQTHYDHVNAVMDDIQRHVRDYQRRLQRSTNRSQT
jgi:hypothetical protein